MSNYVHLEKKNYIQFLTTVFLIIIRLTKPWLIFDVIYNLSPTAWKHRKTVKKLRAITDKVR